VERMGLVRFFNCWDSAFVSISMIEKNEQAIHCRVQEAGKAWSCFVSVIHGDNCKGKRESLWVDLISCSSLFKGSPWWVERESETSERGEREIAGEKTKEKSRGKIVMKLWSKRTDDQHPNSVHT
jgi:hypothetical protein